MSLHLSIAAALVLGMSALARDCGQAEDKTPAPDPQKPNAQTPDPQQPAQEQPAVDGPSIWKQVFGTWNCTAAGREPFAFDVIQKTEFGHTADWVDHATGATLEATVDLTNLYLFKADKTSLRNFEYKTTNQDSVLDHMDEWKMQAGDNTPYTCKK